MRDHINQPKVSVIIPVYNTEKYLRECLDSAVGQTLRDIEIICVDDGSTDTSPQVLEEYRKRDSRISVYRQTNQGPGAARNKGIERAKGKYLAFLDGDDILLPKALEHLYRRAEKTDADVVLSNAYTFEHDPKCREECNVLHRQYLPKQDPFCGLDHAKYLFQITSGHSWGKLFRRDMVERNRIRFPGVIYGEDVPFVYLSYSLAERITALNGRLILYRTFEGSGSGEDTKDRVPLSIVEAARYLWTKLAETGLDEALRQTFVNTTADRMAFNLRTLKTRAAFEYLYDCFKNEMIPEFDFDFSDASYYYNKVNYRFLKAALESESAEDFLFWQSKNAGHEAEARIKAGWSYRIGRAATWLLRKLRDIVRGRWMRGLR